MRDLITLIENLSKPVLLEKSRGLLFRAKDDRFFKGKRDNPESVLLFDRAEYYPQQPGNYDTHEEMMAAYQDLATQYQGMQAVNKPTSASKAFAVIVLTDEKTRRPVYFARFYTTIKPDMSGTWSNGDMQAFGYQLDKETSLKASYGLKPSDIFPGGGEKGVRFKDIYALLAAFKQAEAAQPFVPGFEMLYLDKPQFPVFEGADEFFTAIRDDLGEIIGPVALIQGLNCGTGAMAADRDLLDGTGYGGSSVSFPSGKTNGLVDSYIVTPAGVEIGISSKGEKGATASIKNVADGIKKVREEGSKEQQQLLKTYAKEVKLIERIGKEPTIDFPLNYAIEKGILSTTASDAIRELIQMGAKSVEQAGLDEETAVEISNLMGYKGAKTQLPNYNVGYHALSAIADIVANYINSNPKFGQACLKFLNSSPIIQLHMKASKQKDGDVAVLGFESKYPPNFRGTVALDPSKNYSATAAGGRMNFAYNGVDAGMGDERSTPDTPAAPVSDVAASITGDVAKSRPRKEKEDKPRTKR